jgi:hypothetical protein
VRDPLPLVADVLDKQIFDRRRQKLGKVDGVIVVPRDGRPPAITAIEADVRTAWRRVHPRAAAMVEWLLRRLRGGGWPATRIEFGRIVRTGIDVHVDVDGGETSAYVWETWLKQHFVDRIPGGRRGEK